MHIQMVTQNNHFQIENSDPFKSNPVHVNRNSSSPKIARRLRKRKSKAEKKKEAKEKEKGKEKETTKKEDSADESDSDEEWSRTREYFQVFIETLFLKSLLQGERIKGFSLFRFRFTPKSDRRYNHQPKTSQFGRIVAFWRYS